MINSVWADSTSIPRFPSLDHDAKTDVLIIGGGLAGILCAYQLAQAGIDYMLIEADKICGGVTRNTTAKITSQHGLIYDKLIRQFGTESARMYFDANEAALAQYRQLCQKIPCNFEEKAAYVYSTGPTIRLERELAALERLHIKGEYASKLPIPVPITGAVRFQNQAQFHPLEFIGGIVPGLNLYEQTAARAFHGSTVLTDHGKIQASRIIVATHFPFNNKHGSYFLKMYQDRSYVLALERAQDVNGMYRNEAETGLSFRNYNDLLLLGGGSHRTGKKSSGWAELESFAKTHYPDSGENARWATQDCMTLDGIPYIGQYSKRTPELYVATGFNKWGMTSSMVASMILCDLVQGKGNPWSTLFSPSRTILRPQLLVNAFEAVVHLLTPTKRRCPHMGCALKWNPQEHTWDCPCHGSRFSKDGKLLDNPATGDLK